MVNTDEGATLIDSLTVVSLVERDLLSPDQ